MTIRNRCPARPTRPDHPLLDRGSITPLIIGMMLCLLLLGAGVTAAGSAFLAGQRLQHLCDGAAAAAAADTPDAVRQGDGPGIAETVADYLAVRGPDVSAQTSVQGETVTVTCDNQAPITFGALFGSPSIHRTVIATGQTTYRQP